MSDYISREAVLDELANIYANATDLEERIIQRVNVAVKKIPAADVAPVVPGTWRHYEGQYSCECCGAEVDDPSLYCPGCGAKMDGGADRA